MNKLSGNQRTVPAEYNDRALPFHVEAGKLEPEGDRNYKVIQQFPTLEGALRCFSDCAGYHFRELLYVDDQGKVWQLNIEPAHTLE